MIIKLKQVFDIVDERLAIDYCIDLSQYELYFDKPFVSPVSVKGEVFNRAGVVTLTYTVSFVLKLSCDRCLDNFSRDFSFTINQILVTSLNTDNDEYILVEDGALDLDELVMSDILLNLPAKLLCSKDCKGLCQKCGINLNRQSCHCDKREVDPRLEVLGEFLK